MTLRTAALLLPLALVAGCDRSEPEPVETRPQPILQGSVSDDMLQTDRMQAEAPLAEPEATGFPGEEGAPGENTGSRSRVAGRPIRPEEERAQPAGQASPTPGSTERAEPGPEPDDADDAAGATPLP